MTQVPWDVWMRVGLGELRLTPAQFWNLTPHELMLMTGQVPAEDAIVTRSGLDALMARFPDVKET